MVRARKAKAKKSEKSEKAKAAAANSKLTEFWLKNREGWEHAARERAQLEEMAQLKLGERLSRARVHVHLAANSRDAHRNRSPPAARRGHLDLDPASWRAYT
jgi:hypothetical protein